MIAVLQLQWAGMCQALGRAELEKDPRFIDGGARARHQDILVEMIETWAATFPNNEAMLAAPEAARVPAGPVLTPIETLENEYFLDRGMVRTVHDPILGEIQIAGFPFKFSAQTELPNIEAPLLGQHNGAVLSRVLGYDATRIAQLEQEQVLVSAPR